MRVVAVTGSSGFIGSRLMAALASAGWHARAAGRAPAVWASALDGAQAVVHLAARVHRMGETGPGAETAYERDNAELTSALAKAAASAGVRRFVLVSSVKAMGESTPPGVAWDECAPCRPEDAYGRSKRRAEEALWTVAAGAGIEGVVLRAPLVYGPGVKANMARLIWAVRRGLPLPLASIQNSRSLIFVENLVSAVALCLSHPKAGGETFLVSDGEDLSTPELVRRIGRSLRRPARLLPLPAPFIRMGAAFAGRSEEAGRLIDSLAIDSSKIRRTLGWEPPFSVDAGLARTAERLQP